MNENKDKVMFISVHPDDETLGCGGTILKHKANGDQIYWLNLTNGSLSHPYGFTQEQLDKRTQQLKDASAAYQFSEFINLEFPTQMLDTIETRILVGAVDEVISRINPTVLYIPNRSDVHSDHQVAFKAICACTKNFRKPYIRKILMYETLSETEFAPALAENAFIPNYFIDISEYMNRKLDIMNIYDTEIQPDPFPRSMHAIKGLAAFRGSRIGVTYAEAFTLIFSLDS